jgi:transposase-like protein
MNKSKVRREREQSKPSGGLFVDPSLVERGFQLDELLRSLRLEMSALSASAGAVLMQAVIDAEVKSLTGGPYNRATEYYGWTRQKGYVLAGGQKVPITYQRVRREGREHPLESYRSFQQHDERTQGVFRRMLASVSCRDYPKAIETLRDGYGISKSSVNRQMIAATSKQLDRLCHRSLEDFDLVALMIDGIELAGTVFIGALGVDRQGVKRFLGMVEGATENAEACVRLLENLRERGLPMNSGLLAVLDGSKALYAAVTRFFGKRVLIQRCQQHKIQNVRSHLPRKYHAEVESKLRAAYAMTTYGDARDALQTLVRQLGGLNESAANSLREGMEETLTVHRLGLPEILRLTFATTNPIESTYSRTRDRMRNVDRWRNDRQKARWLATTLLHAESSFRRIKGHRSMPMLVNGIATLVDQQHQQAA